MVIDIYITATAIAVTRHDNFTLSDLNIILAGHSAAGSPAAVKLAVTAAAAGYLSVPSLLTRHCGRNVPGRIIKIGRISCIFQTGIVRAAHFQANNPLAVAQNHIADAFNDNQTVVRSFGAEADRNFNAFDNQGYYRTLGHIQSFFAQIDISKDIIAPDTFRSNDHIVRIGNIDLYIKAELGRVKRNFLNPVTPLKPLSKKGIRRMAVTGLIRRRVHSRTAADAAADHSGAAGAGRTVDDININNPETIQCLEVYKALNQFFFIESDTVPYDCVIQAFIDGKTMFTIGTTDVVKRLEDAKADGSLTFNYGIARMPDVSAELQSRSLSVTGAAVINGYSEPKELAARLAALLAERYSDGLYEPSGKMPASLHAAENADNGALTVFADEYADSVSLPKMLETGNFWMQLEVLFSKVWNGEDVTTLVEQLAGTIAEQVGSTEN